MTATTTSVTTSSIDELQTDEQRRILDTITEMRKQGLEGILSLPQIVVCGDQSAGKSSVLEAIAEIPFPRNDNLCTRFATEISFRREPVARLTVKVIPHESRPAAQQEEIRSFSETITDFSDLPHIMGEAMSVMGIAEDGDSDAGEDSEEDSDASDGAGPRGAFSRDILSIEIEGPDRPLLTLVDIPGLIQSATRGVTDADVAMVAEITDYYIKQPRTICLAVVSATNDAANQPILHRVRQFDPNGERTLGVITKPDRLPHGSGSEAKFLELARNEDVYFKLGWHVIKNRSFEESTCSFMERNMSEMAYFRKSNFSALPAETVGIGALKKRLSNVLFEHVCSELPRLGEELDSQLKAADDELRQMGNSRATPEECRQYLAGLNMAHYNVCRAAVDGNYDDPYFAMPTAATSSRHKAAEPFCAQSKAAVARLRAMVQMLNYEFSEKFNECGHKYAIDVDAKTEDTAGDNGDEDGEETDNTAVGGMDRKPRRLPKAGALEWVRQALLRNRGKELMGNYNPLLVGELFREQSEGWRQLAFEHIQRMDVVCRRFLADLLQDKTPDDVRLRVWSAIVLDTLKKRRKAALDELDRLMEDAGKFPINYNHYYTDNIKKRRQERMKTRLSDALLAGTTRFRVSCNEDSQIMTKVDPDKVTAHLVAGEAQDKAGVDLDQFGCEEILDCLLAIYKVQHKVFVANVVTQVIERHMVRSLEDIFSPMTAVSMSEADVLRIVGESPAARRQRAFLVDRVRKLEGGRDVFSGVLGAAVRG